MGVYNIFGDFINKNAKTYKTMFKKVSFKYTKIKIF